MRSDVIWRAETEQVGMATSTNRGDRAAAARRAARLCRACGDHRALSVYRGVVRADRDHNLCFECYRAEANRLRTRPLETVAAGVAPANPKPRPAKALPNRAAALAEIAARRRHALVIARRALETPGASGAGTAPVS